MLAYEITQDPTAVENLICKEISNCPVIPFSNEASKTFMQLMFLELSNDTSPELVSELSKEFIFQVIKSRSSKALKYNLTDLAIITLMACYGIDNPGIAVMYLTYIKYEISQRGITDDINIDLLTLILPNGSFDESGLNKIWSATKVNNSEHGGSDNLIDYPSAYKSIM